MCAIGALGHLLLPSEFDALLLDLLKRYFWVPLMLLQSFNFASGALLVFFLLPAFAALQTYSPGPISLGWALH